MAVWAGLAGGAAAYGQQQQQAQDDQRWQQRYAQTQAMQEQQERARARYIAAISPPKTDTMHTMDDKGQPVVQAREWIPPSDEDIAAGRAGSFKVTGSTPDIQFASLEERQRQNDAKNEQAQERLRMQGEVNAARMEAAAAKGGAGGTGFSFKDYATADPEQRALYDRYRRGEVDPAVKEQQMEKSANQKADFAARAATRKDLAEMRNPTDADRANTLYENQVTMGADPFASVKAGGASQAPMGQFSGGKPASHGKIVRTGQKNGRKVVQYEDGTIDYAQ